MVSTRRDGAIQAINVRGLVRWASRHDHLLAMQAAVGDFVVAGQHVIAVFSEGHVPAQASRQLQRMVALGVERTMEQDPAFAIRIMADMAVKALSAAINDPTTAVQALHHLGNVLRLLGSTPLHGPLTFRDREGTPRLLMPGRTWADYLTLAVTEIREYGSSSIQVTRRLRAILEDLQESVRPEHRRQWMRRSTSSTPQSPPASRARWTKTRRGPATGKASAARRQTQPAHWTASN